MLVDTHCHLDFSDFDSDRGDVLMRAKEAGVTKIINPGCDLETSTRAVGLADRYSEVFAAVGMHPNETVKWNTNSRQEFKNLTKHKKVVAIGECGIDHSRQQTVDGRQQQGQIFRVQIELAQDLNLPLIIHTRDAEQEVVKIVREYEGLHGVFHCYTGDIASAIEAVELGFYVGFTGIVTFKNATLVQEVVQAVPLERILIETDAPFLSPEPHRGERTEPGYVRFVAAKIAELKKLPIKEVTKQIFENSERLFGI